ncbi:hypothetical protein FB451DRAFT_1433460 [Mycena latifolia]|nr:hypothetical protein FB451DRAFT_1433460 [Mycena latifolia]
MSPEDSGINLSALAIVLPTPADPPLAQSAPWSAEMRCTAHHRPAEAPPPSAARALGTAAHDAQGVVRLPRRLRWSISPCPLLNPARYPRRHILSSSFYTGARDDIRQGELSSESSRPSEPAHPLLYIATPHCFPRPSAHARPPFVRPLRLRATPSPPSAPTHTSSPASVHRANVSAGDAAHILRATPAESVSLPVALLNWCHASTRGWWRQLWRCADRARTDGEGLERGDDVRMCSARAPLAVSHAHGEEHGRAAAVPRKRYPPRARRGGRARSLRADDPHSAALQACRSLSRSAESPSRAASRVYRAAWCRPASPEAPAGRGRPWRGVLWARTPPPGLRLCIPSRAQAAIQAVFLASVAMVLGGSGAMRSGDDRAAAVASA